MSIAADHSGESDFPGGAIPVSGVADYVSALAGAGLPLEAGLRAFAEEAPSWRLRSTLKRMSCELERGKSPEEVLTNAGRGAPGYLRALVRAGIQCGELGRVLEGFLRCIRRRRDLRLRYWVALFYPLMVLPVMMIGGVVMLNWIVPRFKSIFNDFGVELPGLTLAVIRLGDAVVFLVRHWVSVAVLLLLAMIALRSIRWLPGRALRVRVWQSIPLIGTPSLMRGLSEFCSLLSLLVAGRIPLPEALRLTSDVLDDANLREGSARLAQRVEDGETVEDAVLVMPNFPASLANLFRWAHRDATFAEALSTASDLYAARAQVQVGMAGLFFIPLLMLIGGGFLGTLIIALFLPLIKLLNDLS